MVHLWNGAVIAGIASERSDISDLSLFSFFHVLPNRIEADFLRGLAISRLAVFGALK